MATKKTIASLVSAATCCMPLMTAAAAEDVIRTYNFRTTALDRDLANEAIVLVNLVLGGDSPLPIAPHWDTPGEGSVPLYWVGSRGLTRSRDDMMFVVKACPCIIAQPSVFSEWLSSHSGDRGDGRLHVLDLSPPHILAIFLLHELGHIHHEHDGRAVGERDNGRVNLDESTSKERESLADTYVADVLRSAMGDSNFERVMAAEMIMMELGKLSFNLNGITAIESSHLLPAGVWDRGVSHPNFELRVLEVIHRVRNSPETREAVEWFRERQREASGILYVRPGLRLTDNEAEEVERLRARTTDRTTSEGSATSTSVADDGLATTTGSSLFGDDSGLFARDGECDDPRFQGVGMGLPEGNPSHRGHDATDCHQQFESGRVTVRPVDTIDPDLGAADARLGDVDFGDDSGQFVRDGECDDPRFRGVGMGLAEGSTDHHGRDATDCREQFRSGRVILRPVDAVDVDDTGTTAVDVDDIDFGDDSGRFARDGECDDPRFRGVGMGLAGGNYSHRGHDATDCREQFELGRVALMPVDALNPGAR